LEYSSGKWFGDEMSFELLAEDGQQLGKSHVVWQIVSSQWADNRESLFGNGLQLDQQLNQHYSIYLF